MLRALLFGNFTIGTGVMVVPGTLNDISASLGTSVAVTGQLVSAGALLICLGAPAFAAIVAGQDRRQLLALTLAWYALLHVFCAMAPDFAWLLPLRVLAMVAPAVFTPQAAACVGLLVPPAERGRAITYIFIGWSVASVVGMPIGAWIGGTFGWRVAFGAVAALNAVAALWIWRAMPDGVRPPRLSLAAWISAVRSKPLVLAIAVTMLSSAGQFVLFAYLAPYYRWRMAITPGTLALLFAWFGVFGLVGNTLVSRHIDRIGTGRAVLVCLALMATSMLLWPLGTTPSLVGLVVIPWALGCFACNSAQQARLVAIAPALAAGSIALNTSAMYAGQALGTASGGWLITHDRFDSLHWAGFVGLALAMGASVLATRATARAVAAASATS